jgi:nucleolin
MRRELFVGNLAFSITDQILKETFAVAGSVESAKVITDRISGRSRGFGFVTMKTVEEASAAVEKLNNREIQGRPLRVHFSNPDSQRLSQPGRGLSRKPFGSHH